MNIDKFTEADLQRMIDEVFKPERIVFKKMGATSFRYESPQIKLTLGLGAAQEFEKAAKKFGIKIEYI